MTQSTLGYRQLDVWQKSMDLVQSVYRLTKSLPDNERFGLIGQSQWASVSIPANIAEGYGCGEGNYPHRIRIARGSLMELEVYLELFVKLDYIPRNKIVSAWKLSQDVGAMLTRLSQSLDRRKTATRQRSTPNA